MDDSAPPHASAAASTTPSGQPRARGLGLDFEGVSGPLGALTDVPGVEVGTVTLVSGEGPLRVGEGPVRTGVTAVLPRGRDGVGVPCAAGWSTLNGNGEMTGTTWIEEVGALALPITISNTHAVGACHAGAVAWLARHHPVLATQWLLPVVAETWDGYLNDINGGHVRPEHAEQALDAARGGPVPEGSVGGGTGMNCYEFKGGTGTASRLVEHGGTTYTVGVLVQANFGARHELRIGGVPVGRLLDVPNPIAEPDWPAADAAGAGFPGAASGRGVPGGAGSVIAVVATDAPLLPGQCKALARRVPMGLARTGTTGGHFSGDVFLAFSTANAGALTSRFPLGPATDADYEQLRFVPWGHLDPFLAAVAHAVEEAVLNALVVNADMVGRDGHRSFALPHGPLLELLGRG